MLVLITNLSDAEPKVIGPFALRAAAVLAADELELSEWIIVPLWPAYDLMRVEETAE